MNILVLQHINIEDPGYMKPLMLADNWQLTTVQLDEGGQIPADLTQFDAMICMGGPMDTHMEAEYPWLVAEKQAIKQFVVELKKPFLGFCLGAQLLGEVLGGSVVKSSSPEIGVMGITMTEHASSDKLLAGFNNTINVLHWHSYEVQNLPNEVTVLASSAITEYQAFRYQQHAYGVQFHIEVKADTVEQWSQVPEYKSALESSLGAEGLTALQQAHLDNIADINQNCAKMYQQFKLLVEQNR